MNLIHLLNAIESVGVAEAHLGDLDLALEVDDEGARRSPPLGHPVVEPGVGQGVRSGVVVVVFVRVRGDCWVHGAGWNGMRRVAK